MAGYQIIDEPKTRTKQDLIVNPTGILLASMLIPLFVKIPFYGKFWMPFVWLMFNSYLLGSPTFWRELFLSVGGVVAVGLAFVGFGYVTQAEIIQSPAHLAPYFKVLVNATYLIAMYLVTFTQGIPFSVYEYVKGRHE